jgi:hypothetical protein
MRCLLDHITFVVFVIIDKRICLLCFVKNQMMRLCVRVCDTAVRLAVGLYFRYGLCLLCVLLYLDS